ncbi:MAG: ABC transporter ATP-binding protein [Eubacterium sp.]|nr:ABC transporter ATP-binding protein [Eubacterium sp.]
MSDKCILKIENLKKIFHDADEHVLNGIDLELEKEDFLCILGSSGCGKSTFLRCVAGFEDFEGQILVDNEKVNKPGPDRIVVFQDFNQLFPWKTVLNNITYPLKINGMTNKKERIKKAEIYLDKVNLLEYKKYYPHQLSGGMKQRVAIAKGLALGSKITLMDEPFASLDAISRNQLQKELLRIKEKEKMTIIFITHNIQEAISLSNKIMVMSKDGTVKEFIDNPIKKPVTPSSEGYGELWEHLNGMLVGEES